MYGVQLPLIVVPLPPPRGGAAAKAHAGHHHATLMADLHLPSYLTFAEYPSSLLHPESALSSDTMSITPTQPMGLTIAIIGAGSVGSTIAHALLIRRVVADVILVDIDQDLCKAQVEDLSDGTFLSNVRIRQGSFRDASQAEIIIVTAGAKQRAGDTRLDLIDRNFKVLKSVLEEMKPIREDAILLLVANPVDVLTSAAMRMSGLGPGRVLGSGTLLDSVRLTRLLAQKLKVSAVFSLKRFCGRTSVV